MATDVFCHVGIKNKGDRDHGTYDPIRIKKLQAAELACNQPDPFPGFQFHSGPKEHFFNDTWPPELSGQIFEDLQQVIDAAEPFSVAVYEEQLSKIRGVHGYLGYAISSSCVAQDPTRLEICRLGSETTSKGSLSRGGGPHLSNSVGQVM